MPGAAVEMMLNSERIRFACDPYANPMWKSASQMTTGVDAVLPAVAFQDCRRSVDAWAERLSGVLRSGVDPDAVALKVCSIPKKEPWEKGSGETRTIVTRGILGRCVSNHLAAILLETAEGVLPPCALAYRPNRPDVVQDAILSVAQAFGTRGYRYWSKLDIRDCFNQLPRRAVARALNAVGYPERFANLVMASVGAPRYRRVQGGWVAQNADKGCPAGLPESSTLLNLLFLAFDRWVERRCPGLIYYRYCDDLLFIGRTRGEVEKAVAELQRWTKRLDLSLKEVSPNQSARSLVHDVRQRRLLFLGAEIAEDGDIHIPQAVLDGELAKIRFLMDRAAMYPGLILGPSRYATAGRRRAGIATHDWSDVRASVLQFYRYWFLLNRGEAQVFLGRVEWEFGTNPRCAAGPYRKVWGAALGTTDDLVGGGMQADQDDTSPPLERWVRHEVIPLIRDVQEGVDRGPLTDLLREMESLVPRGTSDPLHEALGEGRYHRQGHHEQEATNLPSSTPESHSPLGWCLDGVADAKELDGSAIDAFGLSAVSRGPSNGREASGTTTMGLPAPPGQPLDLELRLIFLRHDFSPSEGLTRVYTEEFDSSARRLGTWQSEHRDQQPATAVLEHLVRRVSQTSGARLVVAMKQAWLAKLLLQDKAEFRSLALFQRVQRLHQVARRALILGPVHGPAPVSTTH